jgi:pantoate--beta-alanine ligase
MVRTLDLDAEVKTIPTVRAEDGLALSSRNARLSPEGRTRALAFSAVLRDSSVGSAEGIEAAARHTLEAAGVEVSYATVVDNQRLQRVSPDYRGPARVVLAGVVEGVRLLDNGPVVVRSDDAVSN